MDRPSPVVSPFGRSVPRVDGNAKVTGRALYLDDLDAPGAWYGATVRSAVAHGDFKLPLFLPGEATLWSAAPSPTSRDFEVRDLAGDKPHLRGRFEWELP